MHRSAEAHNTINDLSFDTSDVGHYTSVYNVAKLLDQSELHAGFPSKDLMQRVCEYPDNTGHDDQLETDQTEVKCKEYEEQDRRVIDWTDELGDHAPRSTSQQGIKRGSEGDFIDERTPPLSGTS